MCHGLEPMSSHPISLLTGRGNRGALMYTMTWERRVGPSLRSDWPIVEPECTSQVRHMGDQAFRQLPEDSVAEHTPSKPELLRWCLMPDSITLALGPSTVCLF